MRLLSGEAFDTMKQAFGTLRNFAARLHAALRTATAADPCAGFDPAGPEGPLAPPAPPAACRLPVTRNQRLSFLAAAYSLPSIADGAVPRHGQNGF